MLVTLLLLGIWIYCCLDVLRTDASELRHLSKTGWLAIAFFGFLIGSVLWLLDGRPRNRQAVLGSRMAAAGPLGPDDDPAFLRDLERRLRGEDG
ncbi:PLDc N-terminal domain-containing protein [Actinomadura sp. 7K507]|uniref:PLDc N-terminal domain-containing protein n=1 Tax=Actinomadura sp. 7K507 TaxID=2530365 RepID=UPI001FB6A824|nr:PLDc N-terminal domain-containing protein [Actinomadura sp. 7K507]